MTSKYDPLAKFLATQQDALLTLTFQQVEGILGCTLPPSAHHHDAWWSNELHGTHVQSRSWTHAGWVVANADRHAQRVTWVRGTPSR